MKKCVFLDRDGVINEERGDYTYRLTDFKIIEGVLESIDLLSKNDFRIIVITNQAGISKGIYTREQMQDCHQYLLKMAPAIDHIYYAPYHHSITESLLRKPDTLMLEKAIAKYNIDPSESWLLGDAERDIQAGKSMGIKTIKVGTHWQEETMADYQAENLFQATNQLILS